VFSLPPIVNGEFRLYVLRFRLQGLGFRICLPLSTPVNGGFQVQGFGFRVQDFGFQVSGLGFRVSGFGFRV